ncbi:hypothetical protein K437DRAFT_267688 [Tilletiaria anomala UBC 951]|uniref:HCP-like protein n=1 Tax=Tilletiaria anomala (strain ATCC 24038 / CBS 436.72 / UBC 951) TaxID=1037660 RepID=A0A066WAT2_TILAU|nr:uncharacterized protein K437DRAFT_267688 [Tilletiaria anomala UBC 951]KDN48199.1 hypothetical protein K437DRAFT_267688 [Tilletiaria anomala UBC 951]
MAQQVGSSMPADEAQVQVGAGEALDKRGYARRNDGQEQRDEEILARTISLPRDGSHNARYTPQEAYDRALRLLRSVTLAHQRRMQESNSKGSSGAPEGSDGDSDPNPSRKSGATGSSAPRHSVLPSWKDIIRATYSPFGIVIRVYHKLSDLFASTARAAQYGRFILARTFAFLHGITGGDPGATGGGVGAGVGRLLGTGSTQRPAGAAFGYGYGGAETEQKYATTGIDTDRKSERAWPSAQPRQLWPEWEAFADEALFGPHIGTGAFSRTTDKRNKEYGLSYTDRLFRAVKGRVFETLMGKEQTKHDPTKRPVISPGELKRAQRVEEAVSLLQAIVNVGTDKVSSDAIERSLSPKDIIAAALQAQSPPAEPTNDSTTTSSLERPLREVQSDALWVLGEHHLWGTHGSAADVPRARAAFEQLAQATGNSSAHVRLGFLDGSGWGHGLAAGGVRPGADTNGTRGDQEKDDAEDIFGVGRGGAEQASALLHFAAAARSGDPDGQVSLGYRHWAGIGTPSACQDALVWYEKAADHSYARFMNGPPGGLTLPYTKIRLSDIEGGVYGPGASVASTGTGAQMPQMHAVLNSLPGSGADSDSRRLEDMLEFYTYHADNGEPWHMLFLARIYYHGSLWGPGETAGAVATDYGKSLRYLLRIASQVWPRDSGTVLRGGPAKLVAGPGERGEDVRMPNVDNTLLSHAGTAAGMIGHMYLRGEGVPQDFHRAWVWFQRGIDLADAVSHNGVGIMLRDGLGVPRDVAKAVQAFEIPASEKIPHTGAIVNIAKILYDIGDRADARKRFETAIFWGNPFESYYWLAKLNSAQARSPQSTAQAPRPQQDDLCRLAVVGFKRVVERGDWDNPVFHRAEKAWRRGHREKALLGWMMAGERGYEAAQNNIAWILDRDKRMFRIPAIDVESTQENNSNDRLALLQWTRSAGQNNIDALVKMGDYYFRGLGTESPGVPSYVKAAFCYQAAADSRLSALAYWNLAWMHETGVGVPRQDFVLAKRYYDTAWVINRSEAYLPVLLSLIRLHLRALWATATRGDATAASLWSSYAGSSEMMAYTEQEEHSLEAAARMGGLTKQQSDTFLDNKHGHGHDEYDHADPNLPESYDQRRLKRFDDELEGDDWSQGEADAEGTLEGFLLVLSLSALAYFVYLRQQAQLRLRQQGAPPPQHGQQQQEEDALQEFPDPRP